MKTLWAVGVIFFFVGVARLTAGSFFEGKTIMARDYDVNVSIMRWGTVDKTTDRIIGQIISDNHEAVTLVFEYAITTQQVQRLTINTGTHVFGKWKELDYWSPCTVCEYSRKGTDTRVSAKAKGAKTTGGCFFVMEFPRIGTISKMRLVNVLAGGMSVQYITKFNMTSDLLRSPMQVPVSKTAELHTPEFKFEDVENPLAKK